MFEMKPLTFSLLCLVLFVGSSTAAELDNTGTPGQQTYFDWTDLQFDRQVYAQRRANMVRALATDTPAIFLVPSASGITHGETFRQLDDFLYFTGLEVPQSLLVLDSLTGATVLFVPEQDPRFYNPGRLNDFPGRPLAGDSDFIKRAGIADVRPFSNLRPALEDWLREGRAVKINTAGEPVGASSEDKLAGIFASTEPEAALLSVLQRQFEHIRIKSAHAQVASLRMIKGPEEIAVMRRAAEITSEAIMAVAAQIVAGIDERSLEAELESVFKKRGAQGTAFASIIKSGPNSVWPWRILAAHHDRRNRTMSNGELVILDVGASLDHYVADVGRTFPVSGKFTAEQRSTLELQILVADTIISAVKPGVSFAQLMALARAVIPPEQAKYMQTGSFFGHHIGLSPGDPALLDVPLAAGMIFTVEPWYYNHDRQIAVFTEDVILVTESGHEILSGHLPRQPEELERMVGGARVPSRMPVSPEVKR